MKPSKKKTPAKTKPAKTKPAKKGAKRTAKPVKPAKKVAPKKVAPKKPAKRHPAKAKPAKAAKHAKAQPKAKPTKKSAPKKSAPAKAPTTERQRHPAKAKPAKRGKSKAPAKPAKRHPAKATKPSKPATPAAPKKRGRPRNNSSSTATPAKPAKTKKVAEVVATPARPQKRQTGDLIISKRGRKSKKERAAVEAQSIFVPRDVKAENTEESQTRDARAYSPDELEQLLSSRGVSNMNVFDPKTATTTKVEKKKAQKKIILTTLPKAKKKKTVGPVSVSDLFGFNPFAKNSTSQEEKLIPEKWRKYYHKLMDRKEALLARLNGHSEKAFQKEGKEETGDVSAYSQHTADIDNDAFDRDLALSRLPAEQEELSEINIAIERMKKGTYGICEITGKPIPAERLNKVPFTRYSIEGKLEAEKQRGLAARRRRANTTGDISEVIDLENDAPVQLPEEENEEPQQ